MLIEWWYWAVAGGVLILAELLVTSFFILWFGLGALMVAVILLVEPTLDVAPQVIIWTLSSIAMVLLWFTCFRRPLGRDRWNGELALDEVGLLVMPVTAERRGKVRFQKPVLGNDEWSCYAETPIPAGERVRVLAIEGDLLKVVQA